MAGSNDAAVRIWGVTGGLIKSTLMGHDNKILTVKFYQHSSRAVSSEWSALGRLDSGSMYAQSAHHIMWLVAR